MNEIHPTHQILFLGIKEFMNSDYKSSSFLKLKFLGLKIQSFELFKQKLKT